VFPKEISLPIREWVEDSYTDIVHWERYDKGGHFAAFEVPEVFVGEIRAMFRRYRPGF
jgi:pimeloyl-ACP methyl ester carboxylesterase